MIDEFVYLVAEGNLKKYENGWSKWRTPEQWKIEMKSKPNYETILPEKIVLETDFPKPETNRMVIEHAKKLLMEKNISFKIYFTGNKSYHLEAVFPQLKEVPFEKRPKAKATLAKYLTNESMAEDWDPHNFGNKAMLQIPGTPHRKTGKLKKFIFEYKEGNNTIPESLMAQFLKEPQKEFQKNYNTPPPTRCNFLEYACTHKLEKGKRNRCVAPNIMACMPNRAEEFAKVQNMPLSDVTGWCKPKFKCDQIQKYAGEIGLRRICDLCLLEGKING